MEILSSKDVTTRKSHICWGCAKAFPEGTVMNVVACIEGRKASSAYWCKECVEKYNQIPSYVFEDGMVMGELAEYWDDYYEQKK